MKIHPFCYWFSLAMGGACLIAHGILGDGTHLLNLHWATFFFAQASAVKPKE